MINRMLIKKWILNNVDLCFLSETHLAAGQFSDVPPFITLNNQYSVNAKNPRGGVSCLISPDYKYYTKC